MSEYANNLPTTDKTFTPAGPSDIPSPIEDVEFVSSYPEGSPARAVDELIASMAPQRKLLTLILNACTQPITMDELKARYDELWEYSPTVFTAYDLCVLLEEAGGIERVTADGSPYDMSAVDPIIVKDEATGAVYYQANEPADLYWSILEGGQTILDDDDPLARAQGYFEDDPELQPLYKRLLTLCKKGKTIEELNDAINYDDLSWEPRVVAAFFVDRMEKADAIEWKGTWQLTDVGAQALELLAEVEDSYDAKVQAANKAAYLAEKFENDDPEDPVVFEGELIDQAAIKAASAGSAS